MIFHREEVERRPRTRRNSTVSPSVMSSGPGFNGSPRHSGASSLWRWLASVSSRRVKPTRPGHGPSRIKTILELQLKHDKPVGLSIISPGAKPGTLSHDWSRMPERPSVLLSTVRSETTHPAANRSCRTCTHNLFIRPDVGASAQNMAPSTIVRAPNPAMRCGFRRASQFDKMQHAVPIEREFNQPQKRL